jgi:predicted lactoylglutathione lyase
MTSDVPAQFSIVTLGVADLERSARFYRDLGWEQRGDLDQGITWFKTSGSWLGLFGHDALAEDTGLESTPQGDLPAYRGITLALNLGSREAVDRAFAQVQQVGGRVVKAPEPTPWGGYSGYFADPDGHLWEVAWNPEMLPPD